MLLELASTEIYSFLLIFVRVGAALLIMPTFSEPFINTRIRLGIALLLTLVVTPVISPGLPPLKDDAISILLLLLGESFIGFFLGTVARIMMSALQTAGMSIAMMIGLANALTQDLTAEQQGSVLSSLLMTIGLLVIFALNLHHLLILAVVNSYQIFIPGEPILVEDFAFTVARVATESFKLGIQLAAPFIGLGLVFYSAMGIINRLMPSMQIFFVAIPLQVGMGLALMALSLPVLYGWFIEAFEAQMMQFLVP